MTHLLKIGLDVNKKREYSGNTLLYRILNRFSWISVCRFKDLMEHFEDVNVGEANWIFLLEINRELIRQIEREV